MLSTVVAMAVAMPLGARLADHEAKAEGGAVESINSTRESKPISVPQEALQNVAWKELGAEPSSQRCSAACDVWEPACSGIRSWEAGTSMI